MTNHDQAPRPETREALLNNFFDLADGLVPKNYDRPMVGMPVAEQPEFPLARIGGEDLAARSEEASEAARKLKIAPTDEVEMFFALPVTVQSRDGEFDGLAATAALQINRPGTGRYDVYTVERGSAFDTTKSDMNSWHTVSQDEESLGVMDKLVAERQIEDTLVRLDEQVIEPIDGEDPLIFAFKAVLSERRENIRQEVDDVREIELDEAKALAAIAQTLADRAQEFGQA